MTDRLREVKLTPEYYQSEEIDRNIAEFIGREENKRFLGVLKATGSEEVRLRGEGVLKLEYAVLKERARNLIVKDYLDSEISAVQAERAEVGRERERFLMLSQAERQLQDEKKMLD